MIQAKYNIHIVYMNFKEFLLKYTTINPKFIEDFSNIIKEEYIEQYNSFLIDSETLKKWLKIENKRIFYDTIKNSYRLNIDYKIEKIKTSSGSGGHNKEHITLTPEAAKKICLMTKSKMGNDVRQYFIDIEFAFYKFKNHIIDSLNRKIEQLENNQKPKINTTKGIIYVFRALNDDATLYKIGRTINSKQRFNSHNSPLANDLEVIMIYEADNVKQLESCIKIMMKQAQYRKYKEIYQVDLDIVKDVIKDCDKNLKQINDMIIRNNKKKGGDKSTVTNNDRLFMLIPNS
jgi:phage anti-repressor protein